jgi:hypothetical protein
MLGDQSMWVENGSTRQVNSGGHWLLEVAIGTVAINGMDVDIRADKSLKLTVGASQILLTPTTIAIQSPTVLINSGGTDPGEPPDAQPNPPAATEASVKPFAPATADDGTKFDKL